MVVPLRLRTSDAGAARANVFPPSSRASHPQIAWRKHKANFAGSYELVAAADTLYLAAIQNIGRTRKIHLRKALRALLP